MDRMNPKNQDRNDLALRVLVTGCGGIGGVNFVKALRGATDLGGRSFYIVGTEFNRFYVHLALVDNSFKTPRHSDSQFLKVVEKLVADNRIEFLHPNPSSEARVIRENLDEFKDTKVKTFLPGPDSISPPKDEMWRKLKSKGVPVPETELINSTDELESAFRKLGSPLWLRMKKGAGARLSLKVNTPQEARLWLDLNRIQNRAEPSDFIFQQFLPGRDLAIDSLWKDGKRLQSSCRERIEYPFKHLTLTGLTGTPSVARTISGKEVNVIGEEAVKAIDPRPNGFYSVDAKEDSNGRPIVTEVDGKWHTTASLWGLSFSKVMQDIKYNVAYNYVMIGCGEFGEIESLPSRDSYPEDFVLIRQMDSGVVLLNDRTGEKWRIEQ